MASTGHSSPHHSCKHYSRERQIQQKKKLGCRAPKRTTYTRTGSPIRFSDRACRNEYRRGIRAGRSRKSFTAGKVSEEKNHATEAFNDSEHDRVNDVAPSPDWLRRWKCSDCSAVIDNEENDKLTDCPKISFTKACDIRHLVFANTSCVCREQNTERLVEVDVQQLLDILGTQEVSCKCRGHYEELNQDESLEEVRRKHYEELNQDESLEEYRREMSQ